MDSTNTLFYTCTVLLVHVSVVIGHDRKPQDNTSGYVIVLRCS